MKTFYKYQILSYLLIPFIISSCQKDVNTIQRPEKIVSKRQVVYDLETYSTLADLWKDFYNANPSDESYANWMYASRYAKHENYSLLLKDGINKYPYNPTLLYLTALLKHGGKDNYESIELLEKSIELDPTFIDPLFVLVVDYIGNGEIEKADVALRKLLTNKAIEDEVMDYNYNVLTCLDKDAILITNGDNDTYPAWILTKILKYRPDVKIVNRSLLNSEWYADYLIKNEDIPNFITSSEFEKIRDTTLQKIKDGQMAMPQVGPFSDILIAKLINSAKINNRPIYLAATLYRSNVIIENIKNGLNLGLVTKLHYDAQNISSDIEFIVNSWLNNFRTGSLTGWQLKYSKTNSAGKKILYNYGDALFSIMEDIKTNTPYKLVELFNWYKKYILDLLPKEKADKINVSWCQNINAADVNDWCKKNNYVE